jgi:hypothetical protein
MKKSLVLICLFIFVAALFVVAHHNHEDSQVRANCAICFASQLTCAATNTLPPIYLSFIGLLFIAEAIHFHFHTSLAVPDLRGPPA